MRYVPCVVVRVCKLGKHISEKFASRYYDSIAPAINIFAEDYRLAGDAIRAWAFDGSLPVGTFMNLDQYLPGDLIVDIDKAICIALKNTIQYIKENGQELEQTTMQAFLYYNEVTKLYENPFS